MRYCFHQQWDFYLSALAIFETTISNNQGIDNNFQESCCLSTCFGKIFSNISNTINDPCFFGSLLNSWRYLGGSERIKISWAKFSSTIPISSKDSDSTAGITIAEKQYNEIKDWRKGKNLPSEKRLRTFLKGHEWSTPESIEMMVFKARLAKGFDKLSSAAINAAAIDGFSKQDALLILKEIWRLYGRYLDHFSNPLVNSQTKEYAKAV